ncbi:hypothetical protein NZ698_04725 [Chryseobacterium sp. PBS4-4]|uniref:Uncharacterized protein n=1 Tax=Chryseobacterium edaphi TaxID=2976532 RepID=A0ABT2W2P3_9FLAO|nr:hypothetical protein [Chryseobacterium edaphi]MCU7616491.1 hypothetical protein [Chryseobacterium edaphi]
MKIILGTLILISATFSAQEKKADTTKRSYYFKSEKLPQLLSKNQKDILKKDSIKQLGNIYKMPVAKPKDTSVYLSLKEADKDYSKYKILNSIAPEPSKKEIKK